MATVVNDLARVEEALLFVARSAPNFKDSLAIRDAQSAAALQKVILDERTWQRSRAIAVVVCPLVELMGWMQGCDCHEEALRAGQAISCPFKGCRAPKLGTKLASVCQELLQKRATIAYDEFGVGVGQHVSDTLATVVACLQLKFRWVFDMPYLVWRVQ